MHEVITTAAFMAELRRQASTQFERDVKDGLLVPGNEMQKRLEITADTLNVMLKARQLFAVVSPSGECYYPAFFATRKMYDRSTLAKVCEALGDLPGSAKWCFFWAPMYSLGGKSPLQCLRKRKVEAVLDAARAHAEE